MGGTPWWDRIAAAARYTRLGCGEGLNWSCGWCGAWVRLKALGRPVEHRDLLHVQAWSRHYLHMRSSHFIW